LSETTSACAGVDLQGCRFGHERMERNLAIRFHLPFHHLRHLLLRDGKSISPLVLD
jgi:hypothetical protein